ncbi:MAG TPA: rhodanese-like domain-containing protein [Candidatus Obscuribacterales bacterium]
MSVETLSKESAEAVKYFEAKLAFEIGPIGLKHAIENREPIQIIDLRTPELFEKGHIPGAVSILFEDFERSQDKLSKDKTIVVYCYDIVCHLAAKAALWLAKKGYKVKELEGGYEDWTKHNLKVEGSGQTIKASSCCG